MANPLPLNPSPLLWIGQLSGASAQAGKSVLLLAKRSSPGGEADWGTAMLQLYPLLDRALTENDATIDPAVLEFATPPRLRYKDQSVPVQGATWIGRSSECPLVIDVAAVSRRHALVVPLPDDPEAVWVIDFQSAEGISINGKRVRQGRLGPQDTLKIHDSEIHIELAPGSALHRPGGDLGLFPRFPGLHTLGYEIAQARGEKRRPAAVAGLCGLLGLVRVFYVDSSGNPLAAAEHGARLHSVPVSGYELELGGVRNTLKGCIQSGLAQVVSVESGPFLARQTSASIQMHDMTKERALLCLPFVKPDGSRTALLMTVLRSPAVAFRYEDLAIAQAVQRIVADGP